MPNRTIVIGQRSGRLTVESEPIRHNGRAYYECRCDCGILKLIAGSHITTKATLSCGCLHRERNRATSSTHGKSRSPIYWVWNSMLRRCEKLTDKSYTRYGDRGIYVCERWQSFENFYADMGDAPDGMSLDRLDNDGPYTPENCQWATDKEQSRNKRNSRVITHNGRTQSLAAWAEESGLDYKMVYKRLRRGWTIEEALKSESEAA